MDFAKIRATWWSGTCYHIEQLNTVIASTDVRAYAYILHDKDEGKKPHYHFLVQFHQSHRGAWFKSFATDDMGIVFAQPCYIPKGAFDYLIHDTPTARKQNKYLYDQSERISTIDDLNCEDKTDENVELYADLLELLDGRMTWHELIRKKPKRIHTISNIKTAYDMLHFEAHGRRFFDAPPRRQKPDMQPIPPMDGAPW